MRRVDLSVRGKEIFSRGHERQKLGARGETETRQRWRIDRRGLEIYDNICRSRTDCEMKFEGYETFAGGILFPFY